MTRIHITLFTPKLLSYFSCCFSSPSPPFKYTDGSNSTQSSDIKEELGICYNESKRFPTLPSHCSHPQSEGKRELWIPSLTPHSSCSTSSFSSPDSRVWESGRGLSMQLGTIGRSKCLYLGLGWSKIPRASWSQARVFPDLVQRQLSYLPGCEPTIRKPKVSGFIKSLSRK